jgi:hypothetical protein
LFVQVKFKKYLILTAVIDTNYGKTTRIPNIPETGTKIFFFLKTAIKSFESCGFFWVGRLTANKQHFNLGPIFV